jgi:putative ABC transport system permease protein
MALWAHMPEADFASFLGTAPFANQAMLAVDRDRVDEVQRALLDMPLVGSAMRKDALIAEFRDEQVETMRMFSFVLTLFAVTIAISVVYNNARVALSMRSRELASLRVLGFTRKEISSVLISELAVQVLIGIPIGLVFGKQLVTMMLSANDPESFRFPISISRHTYAVAALVTVLAAAGSALLVRRKLDKLDLIGVLKARD